MPISTQLGHPGDSGAWWGVGQPPSLPGVCTQGASKSQLLSGKVPGLGSWGGPFCFPEEGGAEARGSRCPQSFWKLGRRGTGRAATGRPVVARGPLPVQSEEQETGEKRKFLISGVRLGTSGGAPTWGQERLNTWPEVTLLQRAGPEGRRPASQLLPLQTGGGRGRPKGDRSRGAAGSPGYMMPRSSPHEGPRTTAQNHGAATSQASRGRGRRVFQRLPRPPR